jgi:Protein of unknown function (DUF3223)
MPHYEIGCFSFPSKKAAIARIREILYAAPLRQPLAGEQKQLMRAVLSFHPDVATKVTGGCAAILVDVNIDLTGLSSRGFQIVHRDGTSIDFSYRVALGLASAVPRMEEAARCAVAPGIIVHKRTRFDGAMVIRCEETGEPITSEEAEVDHASPWPFRRILQEFVKQYGVRPIVDRGLSRVFASERDSELFRAFHDARARLRIVRNTVRH